MEADAAERPQALFPDFDSVAVHRVRIGPEQRAEQLEGLLRAVELREVQQVVGAVPRRITRKG